ncbi:hypothetical protein DsansV1_C11g0111231 [Dioscorea sansibarensis]
MSMERTFEPWEEMQRHGQDLADRLAQGFTGLIQSHISAPPFPWPPASTKTPFDADFNPILDIGSRIGQAGADFGSSLHGLVHQFFRRFPAPFRHEEEGAAVVRTDLEGRKRDGAVEMRASGAGEVLGYAAEQVGVWGLPEASMVGGLEEATDEEGLEADRRVSERFGMSQGSINITSTYNSRTNDYEGSLVAKGDMWRVEASRGGSTSGNESSPLFLVQLGPVLLVRDTTLLLPVHLSKKHLLWYGYDRKNGMHSLCPAMWSKHRWLLMSMICLNPLALSFMDLQFPNGHLTYVAGEGLTTSAFLPCFGGLLQAHSQYPGETRLSFSCKNKHGTQITPMVQWPDKSFSLGVVQALAWKRCGLMMRPTIEFSVCPTVGGSNPGLHAELVHSVKEKLSLICGYSGMGHPSAFVSVSLGRSKWNKNVGKYGIVVRAETPVSHLVRPSFSVQLNLGTEF